MQIPVVPVPRREKLTIFIYFLDLQSFVHLFLYWVFVYISWVWSSCKYDFVFCSVGKMSQVLYFFAEPALSQVSSAEGVLPKPRPTAPRYWVAGMQSTQVLPLGSHRTAGEDKQTFSRLIFLFWFCVENYTHTQKLKKYCYGPCVPFSQLKQWSI